MRLSSQEIDTIKKTLLKDFPSGIIYLHGSRIDDTKKGGDIDLFFIVPNDQSTLIQKEKLRLNCEVSLSLNEQKVDIIFLTQDQTKDHVFYLNSQKILL